MKSQQSNIKQIVFWGICIAIFGIYTAISVPSKKTLNEVNSNITTTKQNIKKANNYIATAKQKNQSDAKNYITLQSQEKLAYQKLSNAFNGYFGGVHNDDEFKKLKNDTKACLGSELIDKITELIQGTTFTNAQGGGLQETYLVSKNLGTEIVFGNVQDKRNACVDVVTQYEIGGLKATKIFSLGYDLTTQKVNSSEVHDVITKQE